MKDGYVSQGLDDGYIEQFELPPGTHDDCDRVKQGTIVVCGNDDERCTNP